MRHASSATSKMPMPSTLLAVPKKYLSTKAFCSPTASKICAPQYDWYVEMPILDITLLRPLQTALMKRFCASFGSTPGSSGAGDCSVSSAR